MNPRQCLQTGSPTRWCEFQKASRRFIVWCCFYYFVRNSLVTLLQALFSSFFLGGENPIHHFGSKRLSRTVARLLIMTDPLVGKNEWLWAGLYPGLRQKNPNNQVSQNSCFKARFFRSSSSITYADIWKHLTKNRTDPILTKTRSQKPRVRNLEIETQRYWLTPGFWLRFCGEQVVVHWLISMGYSSFNGGPNEQKWSRMFVGWYEFSG